MSNITRKALVNLAVLIPTDFTVRVAFPCWYQNQVVTVTAVLERTCVIMGPGNTEKRLVNKHLLFVEDGFTLAVADEVKQAKKARAQRGWRTNWRRKA